MKIKEEFIPLLENGTKTIELRKVKKWDSFFNKNNYETLHGRLEIKLFNSYLDNKKGYEKLGTITINGYEIIKNPFLDIEKIKEIVQENKPYKIIGWEDKHYIGWYVDNKLNFNFLDSIWIRKYWDWLKEYFKDNDEILVLNIEKFVKKEK